MSWPTDRYPRVDVCCCCCCCCDLKSGTFILGWMTLILEGLEFIFYLVVAADVFRLVEVPYEIEERLTRPKYSKSNTLYFFVVAGIIIAFQLIVVLVRFCTTIVMMVGICMNNSSKVSLWLKVSFVIFVYRIAICLIVMAAILIGPEYERRQNSRFSDFIGLLFALALYIVFETYAMIVVNSYYHSIKPRNEPMVKTEPVTKSVQTSVS